MAIDRRVIPGSQVIPGRGIIGNFLRMAATGPPGRCPAGHSRRIVTRLTNKRLPMIDVNPQVFSA